MNKKELLKKIDKHTFTLDNVETVDMSGLANDLINIGALDIDYLDEVASLKNHMSEKNLKLYMWKKELKKYKLRINNHIFINIWGYSREKAIEENKLSEWEAMMNSNLPSLQNRCSELEEEIKWLRKTGE